MGEASAKLRSDAAHAALLMAPAGDYASEGRFAIEGSGKIFKHERLILFDARVAGACNYSVRGSYSKKTTSMESARNVEPSPATYSTALDGAA